MVGGSAAAAIVFLVVIMHFASAPSYSTLLTGVDPAQTGKITSTLDAKGVGYELQNDGTALAVESSQTSAGAGRARQRPACSASAARSPASRCSTAPSSAPRTSSSRSPTSARSRASSTRRSSRSRASTPPPVNLVLPNQQDELFGDDSQSSSASVLLDDSGSVDSSRCKGIAELVASSVQGLDDQQGHDHRLDRRPAVARVGLGHVRRRSDLPAVGQPPVRRDHGRGGHRAARSDARPRQGAGGRQRQPERQPGDLGHPDLRQEGRAADPQTQTETLKGGSPTASGTTGTIPTYAASTGSSSSNYTNKTAQHDLRRRQDRHPLDVIAPGAVKSQSVVGAGRQVGPGGRDPGDQERGDRRRRPEPQAWRHDLGSPDRVRQARRHAGAGLRATTMIGYAKYALDRPRRAGLPVLHARAAPRRERRRFTGQPTWLRELETPAPAGRARSRR